MGHDIVFGAGSLSAATFEGRRLLAHELAHVVQQTAAASPVTGIVQREEDANTGGALSDGERIVTNTLVWTAGTSPNPLLETLPCRRERGRLCADAFLEVEGWPGVWALGDCASVPDPKTGRPCPPTAQHALRQGKVAARNIEAAVRGRARRPFTFRTLGQLAAIGRRTGVANILGVNFSGFFAWWLWRTVYLAKLPRFEKKLRVALDWTLDLLFTKDIVQYMDPPAPTLSRAEGAGHPGAAEMLEEPEAVLS